VILWRKGFEIVSRNLFWLSDEQWKRSESFLPTDVGGVERVDDRPVVFKGCDMMEGGGNGHFDGPSAGIARPVLMVRRKTASRQ
jgi:hypothetical protein